MTICKLMSRRALGSVKIAVVMVAGMLPYLAGADVPTEKAHEVEHLLSFVENSGCEMNRNGSYHTGAEAVAHIQKKYDYFRDKIQTTEDFIEYSATKSTMSGRYYTVKCGDGKEITTQSWLLNELKIYRGNDAQAHNQL